MIPAAIPAAPFITAPFHKAHPGVLLRLMSISSIEIQQGLDTGTLDAGITYLENEPLRNVRAHQLYREAYMLLTPVGGAFDAAKAVRWREAAAVPLCLLSGSMQNRRIVNRLFAEGGAVAPRVAMETDSVLALIAYVRSGGWSSVVPHTYLTLLGRSGAVLDGLRIIPLVEPEATQAVGAVVTNAEPLPPAARAFLASIRTLDVPADIARRRDSPPD